MSFWYEAGGNLIYALKNVCFWPVNEGGRQRVENRSTIDLSRRPLNENTC